MIDTKEFYWLAGLLEGDGHFVWRKAKETAHIYIEVGISSVDIDIIRRLRKTFQIGTTGGPYTYRKNEKDIFKWRVCERKDAAALMMTLYPIMGERRQEQIRVALQQWRDSPKHYERRKVW